MVKQGETLIPLSRAATPEGISRGYGLASNHSSFSLSFFQSPPSSECSSALQRMNTCPTCSLGRTELRPCKNFCLDVMSSCLDSHIEIQEQWDKLVGE